jgi:hypothetical protein
VFRYLDKKSKAKGEGGEILHLYGPYPNAVLRAATEVHCKGLSVHSSKMSPTGVEQNDDNTTNAT